MFLYGLKQRIIIKWHNFNFAVVKWWDEIHHGPAKRQAVREEAQHNGPMVKYMTPPDNKAPQFIDLENPDFSTIRTHFSTQEEADHFVTYVRLYGGTWDSSKSFKENYIANESTDVISKVSKMLEEVKAKHDPQ